MRKDKDKPQIVATACKFCHTKNGFKIKKETCLETETETGLFG